jgi:iduronate 2-sulfatase
MRNHAPSLTELIDLYPTLCDLAGIQGPEGLEGTSLVPWLRDPDHPGREAAFMQYPRENAKVMGYSVKTADARYVRWIRMESGDVLEEEFYDHTTDPGETVNLVNDPAVQDQVERHRHLHP